MIFTFSFFRCQHIIFFWKKSSESIVTRQIFLLKEPIGWDGDLNKMRQSRSWGTVVQIIQNESSLMKLDPKKNDFTVTKVLEDQFMPDFQSSFSKKSYKIHPLDNQIVEAYEIRNAKLYLILWSIFVVTMSF